MDTAETLRTELHRTRSSEGFPSELRERAGRWALAQLATGARLADLASRVGVSATSLRAWSRSLSSSPESSGGTFLPVVVRTEGVGSPPGGGPVLHTPQGYRVTGLGTDELVAVLRRLE